MSCQNVAAVPTPHAQAGWLTPLELCLLGAIWGASFLFIKVALDDARSEGKKVVPACSYVADYIDRHPEYADLLR